MKKILTSSNLWFIASFFSFLAWILGEDSGFWLVMGFASITFGFSSRKIKNK